MADDSDFIAPPSWLTPPPAKPGAKTPVPPSADEVIALPPGIADSATHKLPAERQRTPPVKPEISFFPTAPGMPAPVAEPVEALAEDFPPPAPESRLQHQAPTPDAAAPAPAVAAAPIELPLPQAPMPAPPAAEQAVAPPVAVQPVVEPVAVDDSETVLSVRRHAAPSWRLVFENGEQVPLDRTVYLGRNPSAGAEHPDAALFTVDDPRKSVSKTHAVVELDATGLWVTDLHSTNGTAVIGADLSELVAEPGLRLAVPAGGAIELGDYTIQVEHG